MKRHCRRSATVSPAAVSALLFTPTARAKHSRWRLTFIAGLLSLCIALLQPTTGLGSSAKESTASGEILVVSTLAQTVAVEVMLDKRPRIIGGKLASGVVLRKGKKKVELEDFAVGEQVTVTWLVKDFRKEIIAMTGDAIAPKQASTAFSGSPPLPGQPRAQGNETILPPPPATVPDVTTSGMIGSPQQHTVRDKETLLDIARQYNLGYNELVDMYPDIDPWLPPVGRNLQLPTQRLLPPGIRNGILINIPEMRLYYFHAKGNDLRVVTHPIGIGDTDFPSEPGRYVVGNKALNPTWYIPPSLRAKYGVVSVPPGPDNPLGKYWLGLKNTSYGIHGTDIPWSVGRTVTHGCIRMYPEDISEFFSMIPVGTPIEIIYEPVKIAKIDQEIYLEVHRDIYSRTVDLDSHARDLLQALGYWQEIDRQRFQDVVQEARGIPEAVGASLRLIRQSNTRLYRSPPTAAR